MVESEKEEEIIESNPRDKFHRERHETDGKDHNHNYGSYGRNYNRNRSWNDKNRRRNYDNNSSYNKRGNGQYSQGYYENNKNFNRSNKSPPMDKRARMTNDEYMHNDHYQNMHEKTYRNRSNDNKPFRFDNTDAPQRAYTFKEFVFQQPDDIDPDNAASLFNTYKLDFSKNEVTTFFVAHKEDDWMAIKYHPIESYLNKLTTIYNARKRLVAFNYLYNNGFLNDICLDLNYPKDKIQGNLDYLLECASILLEGGNESDIKEMESHFLKRIQTTKNDIPSNGVFNEVEIKKRHFEEVEQSSTSSSSSSSSDSDDSSSDSNKSIKRTTSSKMAKENTNKNTLNTLVAFKKVNSLFINRLPSFISKIDLENVCKKFPGFLRIGFGEICVDKKYHRRAWITFDHSVDIYDICKKINHEKIKGHELFAIVNRDTIKKIRPTNAICNFNKICLFDLIKSANLICDLDRNLRLYSNDLPSYPDIVKEVTELMANCTDEEEAKTPFYQIYKDLDKKIETLINNIHSLLPNNNQQSYFLTNVQALLSTYGVSLDCLNNSNDFENAINDLDCRTLCTDKKLQQILDQMIVYLRIVYSIDYYNQSIHSHEDGMPNLCGILHIRNASLFNEIAKDKMIGWMRNVSVKFNRLNESFGCFSLLNSEDALKLGLKTTDQEIEKFIAENTKEIEPDKWLCPLSGKKFRGPDFVRKHIFNKHVDKIISIKIEIDYFNCFLVDKNRPTFVYDHIKQFDFMPNIPWKEALITPFRKEPYSTDRSSRRLVNYKDRDAPQAELDFF